MEDGQLQVDVAEVSDAVRQALVAGLALGVLLGGAHPGVQDAVGDGAALGVLELEFESRVC